MLPADMLCPFLYANAMHTIAISQAMQRLSEISLQSRAFCRWEFKAKHFDSVLLFKMGKFYEMFEMDAHTGAEVLGLMYMKVSCTAWRHPHLLLFS